MKITVLRRGTDDRCRLFPGCPVGNRKTRGRSGTRGKGRVEKLYEACVSVVGCFSNSMIVNTFSPLAWRSLACSHAARKSSAPAFSDMHSLEPKMKSMKKSLLGAAVCAALGFATAAQAGVVIDLFTDPVLQRATTETLGATDFNQSGPHPTTNLIGGYRDLSVTKTSDNNGGVNVGATTMTVNGGFLSFSNDAGVTGRGVVTWDGANNAGAGGINVLPTGFGGTGIDLTAGGTANQIFTDVISADLGFNYSITLWDMDGDSSTLAAGVQFQVNSPVAANYLFSWFNLTSGLYCNGVASPPACTDPTTELQFEITRGAGLIDFTRIGAIQLVLVGSRADVDLTIGSIGTPTIPEPGALALVGVALLGAGAATRRARAAKV